MKIGIVGCKIGPSIRLPGRRIGDRDEVGCDVQTDGHKAPRGQIFLFIAAAIQMVRRNDSDLDNFVIAALLRPPVAPSRAKQLPPAKVSADD